MTDPREPDPFGGVWCSEHGRRECAKPSKRSHQRCHGIAISGLDACAFHSGKTREAAKAAGQANQARIRFRDVDPSEYVDPADVLLWAVTLAHIDLADYRSELQARETDPTSDELDRVARLVEQTGRMAKMALDAKVDERRVRLAESFGDRIAALVRGLIMDLGLDPTDPEVAGKARRRLELMAGGQQAGAA